MAGLLTIHPKVAGGGISGSIALIALYGVSFALTVPVEVAGAVGVIATTVGAYLSPWFAENQPGVSQQAVPAALTADDVKNIVYSAVKEQVPSA